MYEFMIKFDFYQFFSSFCPIFREKNPLMGFGTEKFGPLSPNTPDFPYPKGSPGGNDTHEMCMNELEKCMNFSKNLDFTLPTSIGGFRGPCISQGP
jgi:hypothetical protein